MAVSAEPLPRTLAALPHQALSKRRHEPTNRSGLPDSDCGLDGSCTCDDVEVPLTSEPPLADLPPLTSEPPLAGTPLTSEPVGTGLGSECPDIW